MSYLRELNPHYISIIYFFFLCAVSAILAYSSSQNLAELHAFMAAYGTEDYLLSYERFAKIKNYVFDIGVPERWSVIYLVSLVILFSFPLVCLLVIIATLFYLDRTKYVEAAIKEVPSLLHSRKRSIMMLITSLFFFVILVSTFFWAPGSISNPGLRGNYIQLGSVGYVKQALICSLALAALFYIVAAIKLLFLLISKSKA